MWESPGLGIDVVSRIELGYSYELGSGWTRIRVLTRPRKRLGMVMTLSLLGWSTWWWKLLLLVVVTVSSM